jgi:hypothetical protein
MKHYLHRPALVAAVLSAAIMAVDHNWPAVAWAVAAAIWCLSSYAKSE